MEMRERVIFFPSFNVFISWINYIPLNLSLELFDEFFVLVIDIND